MNNNAIEQFEEMYSRWSMLDKFGKEMQLAEMRQRAQALYQALQWSYNSKEGLTTEERKCVGQLQQWIQVLQAQKTQVDQDLANEMMKHIAKLAMKQSCPA